MSQTVADQMTMSDQAVGSVGDQFVEAVDRYSATINGRGHLTEQGADLISGAVEVLRRSGHRRITVDLHDVAVADEDALAALAALARRLQAHRGELVIVTRDAGPAEGTRR